MHTQTARHGHALAALVLTLASCSCREASRAQTREPLSAPGAAMLVKPPAADTSDQIVSWVEGAVVTDWLAEREKRDRAIRGYLEDSDPGRATAYGFRSGQHPSALVSDPCR